MTTKHQTENADDRKGDNEVDNPFHREALKAREENGQGDPFEDRDNIRRSFPNTVDESGTPDVQPHEPKEALGEGQLSIDSIKAENEELAKTASDKREGKPGFARVSNEEQRKADAKARPNAPENQGK